MAAPSPLHRDPEKDGDDFGCVGPRAATANRAVAKLVKSTEAQLREGKYCDTDDLVSFVRDELERIDEKYDCGSCDTIVKENVFAALANAINSALKGFDPREIYGW